MENAGLWDFTLGWYNSPYADMVRRGFSLAMDHMLTFQVFGFADLEASFESISHLPDMKLCQESQHHPATFRADRLVLFNQYIPSLLYIQIPQTALASTCFLL